MEYSYKLFPRCKNIYVQSRAEAVGYVCMIMSNCSRSASFQIRTLGFWISPAIEHQQLFILFDSSSNPKGYILWACLAPDTEQRLLTDPNFLLHPSEWNEGDRPWVIDFCFPNGAVLEASLLIRKLMREAGLQRISWARRDQDHIVSKILTYRLKSKKKFYHM
ncbi:toxin-activating lysine-acyltransferase [Pseudomonas wayambapalatensis]|uniref:toxin-activating lysine-acyltransferase n=1 Tax=Pseudomonas wayambapalatensis TaxID=485895 RepID=UPI003CF9A13D